MIIRPAHPEDGEQMADILNPLIEDGTSTAIEDPVTGDEMRRWMRDRSTRSTWQVAEADGRLLGFQWAAPHDSLPDDAASIATFARIDGAGRGVGTDLFAATKVACKALGYCWINASIRSDNDSGLRFYTKMGFNTYNVDPSHSLGSGKVTGKTHKRFDF